MASAHQHMKLVYPSRGTYEVPLVELLGHVVLLCSTQGSYGWVYPIMGIQTISAKTNIP